MHRSVMEYVEEIVTARGLADRPTLEVGSRNINGSVRDLFNGEYVGVDMIKGPGVDKVARAYHLPFGDCCWDTVVCTEMLEHDPEPWLSMPEMARVLVPGGTMIVTARGIDFPLHGFPDDYWRFTVSGLRRLFEIAALTPDEIRHDPEMPGVFGVATK